MAIVESLRGAWELASGLGSALSKMSALEAKQAILELQNLLGKIQGEAFELQQQNNELRGRIHELEAQAKTRGQIIYEENVCWLRKANDDREGPFCPVCCDQSNQTKFIHLIAGATKGTFSCGVCNNGFQTTAYEPPGSVVQPTRRRWR